MNERTVRGRTRTLWAIVTMGCLLAGGCFAPGRGDPMPADRCVGDALKVRWPSGRLIDKRIAKINDAGFESAKHYCIGFEDDGTSGEYHVLCGIESAGDSGAKFYLTPRNYAPGQPPEPDPQGPGMRHTIGWSFITFSWPLIWVRNIDAGSIGTTAIMRWQGDDLSLFLVRNGKPTPTSGPLDPPVPDTSSGLWLRANDVTGAPFELSMPPGKEIVRVRFFKQDEPPDLWQPYESAPGVWEQISFDAANDGAGAIVVTTDQPAGNADCAFLAGVLQRAHEEAIYVLPGEPAP